MNSQTPLVLVSNRGPATFERGEDGTVEPRRGGGGLVTALTGLVHHRDAIGGLHAGAFQLIVE